MRVFLVHGFFQFTTDTEASDAKLLELQGGPPAQVVDPSVRDLCRTRLFGMVGDALSGSYAQPGKKGAGEAAEPEVEASQEPGVDVVAELLRACHQAERAKAIVTPVCALDDRAQSVRKDVRAVLKELERLAQEGTSPRLDAAMNLLRMLLLYQLAAPAEFTADMEDLPRSLRAAFGAAAEPQEGKAEPHHMDVLVDSLLSMVSKPHALIRDVCEKVVKAFSGDITHKGVRRMLSQLTRATDSRRGRTSSRGGDGDDDDDTDDVDASDEDDSSDEEVEEDGAVAGEDAEEEAEGRLRTAPGGGESASDSDVEDAADPMDDAAMLKSDVMLSAVLREAKKDRVEKKTAAESVLHFKFRVLSLVEAFVKSQLSSPLLSVRPRVPAPPTRVVSLTRPQLLSTGDSVAPPAGARHVCQGQGGGPGHAHCVADHQLHQQGACGGRRGRTRAAAVQHLHRLHATRLHGLHPHGDARLAGGGPLRAAPPGRV
jgi:DNA polymerase phi